MSTAIVTLLLGTASLFVLIGLHIPVGAAMLITGVVGFGLIHGFGPAVSTVAIESVSVLSHGDLMTIPLFLLMGSLAGRAGLATDIYDLARALIGHFRGGLAMSTVVTCAGFGALSGSSIATTATMARLAMPEMTSRGYSRQLSVGSIAAGGSLGILIPPSIIMVVYAVLTEQFVLDLFIAGIIPGLLTVALYCLVIAIYTWSRPDAGPAFSRAPGAQVRLAILRAWRAALLVLLVIGGIYAGVFTVVEAASFGVVLALLFYILKLPRDWRSGLVEVCRDTASATGLIFLMIIGANIFSYFLTITGATREIVGIINASGLSDYTILLLIIAMYLVLGAVFETVAAMVLTLPFVFPIIINMGLDPIWWGIINVMIIEIGLITPPIGMNIFVMQGVLRDVRITTIYKGILPFLGADVVRVLLVLSFPQIALWL